MVQGVRIREGPLHYKIATISPTNLLTPFTNLLTICLRSETAARGLLAGELGVVAGRVRMVDYRCAVRSGCFLFPNDVAGSPLPPVSNGSPTAPPVLHEGGSGALVKQQVIRQLTDLLAGNNTLGHVRIMNSLLYSSLFQSIVLFDIDLYQKLVEADCRGKSPGRSNQTHLVAPRMCHAWRS